MAEKFSMQPQPIFSGTRDDPGKINIQDLTRDRVKLSGKAGGIAPAITLLCP